MKKSLLFIALVALWPGIVPAIGAPASKPATKAPVKAVADPLDIPAFAPIPNEFVFAGTRKDAYKLLSGYTKGFSLELMPTPTLEQIAASKEPETLQAIANVKNLLEPIHVLRVRSLSYYALGEDEQAKAYEKLGAKTETTPKTEVEGMMSSGLPNMSDSAYNRGEKRSRELLGEAETFYKKMLVDQGGKVQTHLGGETSITVYAFANPQTFAVVTRGPSRVIVARADGKPDVGAITGIFTRVVAGN